MKNFILSALMALAARMDLVALADAIYQMVAPKIPGAIKDRIRVLVRTVDDLDLPGEDKFREVMRQLKEPNSSVRYLLNSIPQQALLSAIQGAYENMER
jgi:hypothetical protein